MLRLFVLQLMYCLCYNHCIVNFLLCILFSGGTWVYQEPFKNSFQWRNWRRKIEWISLWLQDLGVRKHDRQYLMQRNEMANRPNCNKLSSILTTAVTSEALCRTCTWDFMFFLYIDKQNKWRTINSNITCFELLCIFVHFVVWRPP